MPRAKIWGYITVLLSSAAILFIIYSIFITENISLSTRYQPGLENLRSLTYYLVAVPVTAVSLFVLGTGFWIGYTILTIKVVAPMPELHDKKDNSKFKAFLLCTITLVSGILLVYGVVTRNFWSLALPSLAISLVILGSMFWVGMAIITTRSTLKERD
jgi:hypothetical protein